MPRHDLRLIIAGADHGNHAETIRRRIEGTPLEKRIGMITNYSDSQKAPLLSAGDIFISLSDNLQESFGISLIEAMACGLPVICTDWDGYKDIVVHGVTGFRIPTRWEVRIDPMDILQGFRTPYDHGLIHRISQDVKIDLEAFLAFTKQLVEDAGLRDRMGEAGQRRVLNRFTVARQVRAYEDLWDELAEMAKSDRTTYPDLGGMLTYDYPRHFASYPTELIWPKPPQEGH